MASRAELETLDAELVKIAGTYAPITVRGAFYQAVSRGLVPKDETKGLPAGTEEAAQAQGEPRDPLWLDNGRVPDRLRTCPLPRCRRVRP